MISVQQQTPDNYFCHFSISNVGYVLRFGHFFDNWKNSGLTSGQNDDPGVRDDPSDPLTQLHVYGVTLQAAITCARVITCRASRWLRWRRRSIATRTYRA